MKKKVSYFTRIIEEYITLLLSSAINIKFRQKIKPDFDDIRKIAVIKLDHIGDVILSIPAIANLKHRFPDANITMVVNPSTKAIAERISILMKSFAIMHVSLIVQEGSLRCLILQKASDLRLI